MDTRPELLQRLDLFHGMSPNIGPQVRQWSQALPVLEGQKASMSLTRPFNDPLG